MIKDIEFASLLDRAWTFIQRQRRFVCVPDQSADM